MSTHLRSVLVTLWLVWNWAPLACADFQPITLKSSSYNHDVIIENMAPPPVLPVTTASMDGGTSNDGFTWFERGYVSDWPSAGLPAAGSTFASEQSIYRVYRMASSYRSKNAFLIDLDQPRTVITFVAPSNYTMLSFLTSSGGAKNVLGYVVQHQDGTRQSGTITSPEWLGAPNPALAAYGRVNATTFTLADMNTYSPKLFSAELTLTNTFSPVMSAELYLTNGTGHTVVFAVSGAPVGAGPLVPIEVAGYNQDLVVEASALKPGFLETNSTATMESGIANLRFTWYERGYNPLAPQTGLPPAGSIFASETQPDHWFELPPTYNSANAVLLDTTCTNQQLTFVPAACYSALSFLTAAGHGAVTNRCVLQHADGTSETNRFVSPNWLGGGPAALSVPGRVSVSTRLLDRVDTGWPNLYAVDLPVTNRLSAITNVLLSPVACPTDNHAVILAVSGVLVESTPPLRPLLSITKNPDATLVVHSSMAGILESSLSIAPEKASWQSLGPISSTRLLTNIPPATLRFYRVVVH